ncbi:ankyrin repeat-containing domain protein [Talaromyces proteolyticus]|uniref:Ankyrin repeat-containing domain protein n=1 Tax=Talaromyces proteolyticus TaxID=1131652 RepID=A0AAD4L6D6_9EURO|nr:ankyrin repeat-containing domain protein [Talaromyces proteolyticus]KAH8705961.1 ankyrin repeat-containing domain protein [Talaromyces proteolyticus]
MKAKAFRIDSSIWEQYKDEIVAIYQRETLEKTMEIMAERHGFKATKNQYTTKIKAWGLEKYANSTMWKYVDQEKKKRKLEGKDSLFEIRGRKRSRSYIDREISRNVTYTSQVQLLEDIPTPEGIQVFTPCAEESPIALRKVCIDNLPWFQFQRDIEMMTQVLGIEIFGLSPYYNILDQSSSQLDILHCRKSAAEFLEIAFGDAVKSIYPTGGMFGLNSGPSDYPFTPSFRKGLSGKFARLASYIPFSDAGDLSLSTSNPSRTTHPSNKLQDFLEYFVFMTSNDMLDHDGIKEKLECLSQILDLSIFPYLLGLNSVPMKIFTRKIFPAVVKSGNTRLAKIIIDHGIDMTNYRQFFRSFCCVIEHCMSIAVGHDDKEMVELLCKEGFSTQIEIYQSKKLPWNLGNLEVLRTLLLFGADPECFVVGRPRGFPLVDATGSGNLKAVEMLLAAGANVNSYAPCYYGTALQAATYTDNLELAEFLIERDADVNLPYGMQLQSVYAEKGRPRYTPFEIAAEQNNTSLIHLLVSRGAHVDVGFVISPIPGTRALHSAVRNRNITLVRLLLSKGVSVDYRRPDPDFSDTPLQLAARLNHPEITELLLQHGADVNAAPATSYGLTAIQAAAGNNSFKILWMLLDKNADLNAPAGHKGGRTALQAAIMNRHLLMAGYLYAAGADINAPPAAEEDGFTTMEAAIFSENRSILEFLVRNGADINASSPGNGSSRCLAIAASNYWLDGLSYLLDIGSNIEGYYYADRFCQGFNALGWSIFHENIPMMALLLDNGANIYTPVSDTLHPERRCALSVGLISERSHEITSLLLKRYEDLERICLKEDILARAIHEDVEDSQTFGILLNAFNKLPKNIYDDQVQKAWHKLPTLYTEGEIVRELMELLLKVGADINSRDDGNTTALQRASKRGDIDICQYLIDQGAEINIPAAERIGSPLQEAVKGEHMEIISLLLERGADINAAPAEIRGITTLQAASINGLTGLVVELIRRGAYVAAPAAREDGRTAINGAAEHGRHDMLQLLLNHYDGDEDLRVVCEVAAIYAEKEGHVEIAEWLRQHPIS